MIPYKMVVLFILFPLFSVPYVVNSESYIDSVWGSILLVSPTLVWLITSVLALIVSYKKRFYKYELKFTSTPSLTFVGCLFFWPFFITYFLWNWHKISNGTASLRTERYSEKHGTSLILIMLWGILWFIPWLAILPEATISKNTNRNRVAFKLLFQEYCNAQEQFKSRQLSKIEGNTLNYEGYCDNYRNLFYGIDLDGSPLKLIYKKFADAFAGPTYGAPTTNNHQTSPVIYKGFLYLEDPYISENRLWEKQYGLIAYPQDPRKSGNIMIWVWIVPFSCRPEFAA